MMGGTGGWNEGCLPIKGTGDETVEVINIMEKLVWDNLDGVMERSPGVCSCIRCKADMVAYALNHVKPKYVATAKGEVYARAGYLDTSVQVSLIAALAEAVRVVSEHPRH